MIILGSHLKKIGVSDEAAGGVSDGSTMMVISSQTPFFWVSQKMREVA